MMLTRAQLDAYDANSQNAFVLKISDSATDFLGRATNPHNIPGFPIVYTLGMIPEEQIDQFNVNKNQNIQRTGRTWAAQAVEAVPEIQTIIEAIEQFISTVVDTISEVFGFQTDRQKVVKQFTKSAGDIENTLKNIQGVDPALLVDGISRGMRDATTSFVSIQGQIKEEATEAIGDLTGTNTSKADEAAASAAASTYQRVYKNIVEDFKGKNKSPTPDALDDARRRAHDAAAQVAGVYMGEDGRFQPAKDAQGNGSGMFGYIHDGIRQVEDKKEITATFRSGPPDELARAAAKAAAATAQKEGAEVDSTPAAPPGARPQTAAQAVK